MFDTSEITNITEQVVHDSLAEIIRENEIDFCQCRICLQDIIAYSLNRLPQKYVCNFVDKSFPGNNDVEFSNFLHKKSLDVLVQAISSVGKNQHHASTAA